MATLAGDLLIKMSLDVAQLRRDADDAKRTVSSMGTAMSQAAGMIKAGLAGIAASFTFDKIEAEFHKALSAMSALDDASEIAGTSVEKLSSLLGVATESGVGLDGLTSIMQKLTKATLANEQESAKAAQAWKALNIDPRQYDDAADLLMAVAKGFDSYADGAGKAELAQALLGKSGQQALPLLKDLAERGTEQARVTTEMAAEAERLEKQWARLSYEGDVFKQTIFSKIIPALGDLVMQFNKARAAGMGFWESLNTIPGAGMDKAGQIKYVEAQLAQQEARLQRAQARADKGGDLSSMFSRREIDDATAAIAKYNRELSVLRSQQTDMQKRDQSLGDIYGFGNRPGRPDAPRISSDAGKAGEDLAKKQADAIAEMNREMVKFGEASKTALTYFEITQGKFKDFDKPTKATLLTLAAQSDERRRFNDLEKEAIAREYELGKVMEDTRKRLEEADRARIDSVLNQTPTSQQAEARKKQDLLDNEFFSGRITAKQYEEATNIINGIKTEAKQTKDIFDELGATFESAFEKAIDKGGDFSDFMQGLGRDLTKVLMREFVTGPLMQQFKDMLKQIKVEMQAASAGGPSFDGGGGSIWGSIFSIGKSLFSGGGGGVDPGGSFSEGNYQTKGLTVINNIDSRADSAYVRDAVSKGTSDALALVADNRARGNQAFV